MVKSYHPVAEVLEKTICTTGLIQFFGVDPDNIYFCAGVSDDPELIGVMVKSKAEKDLFIVTGFVPDMDKDSTINRYKELIVNWNTQGKYEKVKRMVTCDILINAYPIHSLLVERKIPLDSDSDKVLLALETLASGTFDPKLKEQILKDLEIFMSKEV